MPVFYARLSRTAPGRRGVNQLLLAGLIALAPACMVDEDGEFTSVGTTTTTGGGTGTGGVFPPQPATCEYEAKTCTVDKDCCETPIPGSLVLEACPGPNYPNNWSCDNGTCVHAGCNFDSDCLIPNFTCEDIDGDKRCVGVCDDTPECASLHNMPNSQCLDVGESFKICGQEQP